MTSRLARAREELTRYSPQARDLGDQAEVLGREAVTAGLRAPDRLIAAGSLGLP